MNSANSAREWSDCSGAAVTSGVRRVPQRNQLSRPDCGLRRTARPIQVEPRSITAPRVLRRVGDEGRRLWSPTYWWVVVSVYRVIPLR